MTAGFSHRIDPPMHASAAASGPHLRMVGNTSNPGEPSEPAAEAPTPDDWLRLHSADLIDRLQAWAADLDAREARLNARVSMQENAERQSRLRWQHVERELDERDRSIGRMRQEIEAQARRIAFRDANS